MGHHDLGPDCSPLIVAGVCKVEVGEVDLRNLGVCEVEVMMEGGSSDVALERMIEGHPTQGANSHRRRRAAGEVRNFSVVIICCILRTKRIICCILRTKRIICCIPSIDTLHMHEQLTLNHISVRILMRH